MALYLRTYNELTRELDAERIQARRVHRERDAFLEGLSHALSAYTFRSDIERHMRLAKDSRARGVAVDIARPAAATG